VKGIKHAVGAVNGNVKVFPTSFEAVFFVEATNEEGNGEAWNYTNFSVFSDCGRH
jgi:hypothetical protein